MQSRRNNYIALCILVAIIAAFVIYILATSDLNLSNMLPVIILLVVVAIYLLADIRSVYKEKKLQKTKDFLVKCTSKVYFYGYPLSECIKNGAIMQLSFEGVGDFVLPVAELMLYAIRDEDQEEEPVIYIGDPPRIIDSRLENGPRKVYVNFEFGGQYWLYRVDSFELDRTSLRPAFSSRLDAAYLERSYWDVYPYLRKHIEKCTSPETSNLDPEVRLLDCPEEEYTDTVKQTIRHHLPIGE